MTTTTTKKSSKRTPTSRARQKELLKLSPFELKDTLMSLAADTEKEGQFPMLNAGRGNPNWLCTTPREAFGLLLRFAIDETRRGVSIPDAGKMPERAGSAKRLESFLAANPGAPGGQLLRETYRYGVDRLKLDADAWVHELVDGIIGDMYPVPGRMLRGVERLVHEYLVAEMCDGKAPPGRYDLFAVEGGTAAMVYIFDSMMQNGLLHRGDTIALAVPTFQPYIEFTHLDRFKFKVVNVDAGRELRADGTHSWQYADKEIDKLADKKVKAFFVVNPSNPPSYAMRAESMARLVKLVKSKRRDLMVVTDDVYGTFVPHFRSLMAELPYNTLGVYSYSKHFGCTGWRLGVIALQQENVFDATIAKLPAKTRAALRHRYGSITLNPDKLKFVDRMVADSRCIALNHTAGLSLPQQVQMALFSSFALLDTTNSYKSLCQLIVRRRFKALYDGMGFPLPPEEDRASYYVELDLKRWAEHQYGPEFAEWLGEHHECVDVLFRLAERSGVVLMHGGGFGGPEWSVRVSLANLREETYPKIGQYLREAAEGYVQEWKASKNGK